MTDAAGSVTPEDMRAWERALDDLERRIAAAERQLSTREPAAAAEPWTPPAVAGPMPPELVARARDLLARNQHLLTVLPQALQETRQNLQVTAQFGSNIAPKPPSRYVDQQM